MERTIRVVLMLNKLERISLRRIVATGGHKNAQEAMRYLIRKNDPAAFNDEDADVTAGGNSVRGGP